jgi:hypothetical protein
MSKALSSLSLQRRSAQALSLSKGRSREVQTSIRRHPFGAGLRMSYILRTSLNEHAHSESFEFLVLSYQFLDFEFNSELKTQHSTLRTGGDGQSGVDQLDGIVNFVG